jgi:tetratricopeptide (TPR) repeat protein
MLSWMRGGSNPGRPSGAPRPAGPSAPSRLGNTCPPHPPLQFAPDSIEFDLHIAAYELRPDGDRAHGIRHLARPVIEGPDVAQHLSLLERYAALPDPAALVSAPEHGPGSYVGNEAIRAYFWWKQGRLAAALDRLVQVANALPDSQILDLWALAWVEPADAVEALPRGTVDHLVMMVLNRLPEFRDMEAPRRAVAGRWVAVAERWFARHGMTSGPEAMARVGLLRKAGRFAEAIAVAETNETSAPDWHTAVSSGLALRAAGRVAEADARFLAASLRDEKDIAAFLEAGDMFINVGDWSTAQARYASALARKFSDWAGPSLIYARWKAGGKAADLRLVLELAAQGNGRAAQLIDIDHEPDLPAALDAGANIIRHLVRHHRAKPGDVKGGSMRIGMSAIEAPSVYRCHALQVRAWGLDCALTVEAPVPEAGDPRTSLDDLRWPLWRYAGTTAAPAQPAPPADIAAVVTRVAVLPYAADGWWAAAGAEAARLGPERAGQILAAMVHPPAIPDGRGALAWVQRVQVAAAFIVAQVDAGWAGSARREALRSALLGPRDWVTDAAIRAMVQIAVREPALSPEIHQDFQRLNRSRPVVGYWSWEKTLFALWPRLPHLTADERDALRNDAPGDD